MPLLSRLIKHPFKCFSFQAFILELRFNVDVAMLNGKTLRYSSGTWTIRLMDHFPDALPHPQPVLTTV